MINKEGIDLIKSHEGLSLKAYPDPATGGEPYTIGFGSTYYEDGTKVKLGDHVTEERATKLFETIAEKFAVKVKALITSNVNSNQLSALVSFSYNVGVNALKSSTLLKKVNANPNDPTIKAEFMKWIKANGKVMNGLKKRREAESNLYFK